MLKWIFLHLWLFLCNILWKWNYRVKISQFWMQLIKISTATSVIQSFLKSEDFKTKRSSSFLPDIYWSIVLHSFVNCVTVTFTHFFCWTLSFSYLKVLCTLRIQPSVNFLQIFPAWHNTFFFWPPCSMQDLSSLTRDQTSAPCNGSAKS